MKVEQVSFNVIPSGGSFGRRLFHDPVIHAAQVSQRIGKPVKLTWMREEDIKHGRTRPVAIHHVRATIRGGDVVSFEHRQACAEMDLRHGFGDVVSQYVTEYNNAGASQYVFHITQKLPYKTGSTALTMKDRAPGQADGALRVVYSGQVGTINEIIMDELARMLGKDEVEFRMGLLDTERRRAVLEKCAQEGEWGRELPTGVAQGIGMHDEYKSIVAYLMEVDTRGKEPRMTRCTIAVDVGYCVNPTGTASSLYGPGDGRLRLRLPGRPPRRQRRHPGVELPRVQVGPDVRLAAGDELPHPPDLQRHARRYRRARRPGRLGGGGQRLGPGHGQAGAELPDQRVRRLIAMPTITFNLNDNPVSVDADNDEELLWVLRDRMGIYGLKYGCGMGLCGACTSHVDGVAKRTCITPVGSIAGQEHHDHRRSGQG